MQSIMIRVAGLKSKENLKVIYIYRVAVTNVGQPIPEDKSEKIFDRFYRLEPSDSREIWSSGLGLAIVKEIIELHGGWVGLISKANRHTFWFTVSLSSKTISESGK
ncbi:MAG: ATP-binding protein [Clostridia bacterium]